MKKATPKRSLYVQFVGLMLIVAFMQAVKADGVFADRKKAQHQLTSVELNRIKAEHQIKFGQAKASGENSFQSPNASQTPSKNPWKKKKTTQVNSQANTDVWVECRNYALHKRNRCYREGRDAYRCEQMYEARTQLCDSEL